MHNHQTDKSYHFRFSPVFPGNGISSLKGWEGRTVSEVDVCVCARTLIVSVMCCYANWHDIRVKRIFLRKKENIPSLWAWNVQFPDKRRKSCACAGVWTRTCLHLVPLSTRPKKSRHYSRRFWWKKSLTSLGFLSVKKKNLKAVEAVVH